MNDILEYTDNNNIEAILFSADFEKAFDSVDHTFLFATLTGFGFGPDFIQWVKTFLKDCESCVMNNGHSSGYFPLIEEIVKVTPCQHTFHTGIVHSLSSGKVEMFLCAACYAFTPHVNEWKR